MCKVHDFLEIQRAYNWDGDRIIHDSTVSRTRTIPGTKKKYEVDIRELLLSEHNTVVKAALEGIKERLPIKMYNRFIERKEGCFDFRIQIIKEFVEHTVAYHHEKPGKFDTWLFPDETITIKKGDCEDRAILMAALALASGVSAYNIRIALGYLKYNNEKQAHVWLMYKNEHGAWQIIEPNDYTKKNGTATLESTSDKYYVPYFVFNTDHLWGIFNNEQSHDELKNADCFQRYITEEFMRSFNPRFASKVHTEIVMKALEGIESDFYEALSDQMKADLVTFPFLNNQPKHYVSRLADKVVNVDFTLNYDALAHFDNSQINGSLQRLLVNINDGTIIGLAKALHAIQDFYSHTSFAHFAKPLPAQPSKIQLANITMTHFDLTDSTRMDLPHYDGGGLPPFDFRNPNFDMNVYIYKDTVDDAIQIWNGKVVSGRFGQPHDSKAFLEITQFIDKTLPDFVASAGVPHHEDIAVDKSGGNNTLYDDADVYESQFLKRKDAATRHTTQLVKEWILKKTT